MNWEIIVFVLYFVILFGIALVFFFNGSNRDQKDYFLGGRSMGPWVAAMSAQASDMSAWLLMGLPGSILAFGFGQIWIGIGLALGTAANWIFCAKRLREFSKAANDSITLPQYLTNRFASSSPILQIVCALIFLIAFTIYVSSAFVAGTSVLTMLFPGINERIAMTIFALVIIGYTFLGGFKAVCWTDFFQGILMLIALLAIPIIVVSTQNLDTGLLSQVYEYTDAASGEVVSCDFGAGLFSASWQDVVSGLGWGLGYFGMPHILVRFMSIEKPSMVKKSSVIAIVWVVLSIGAACLMAYQARMIVGEELLTVGAQKTVFIVMARRFFPPLISGFLLAAIMAASVSTADSQLLVASSSFTADMYQPIVRKDASDKEVLWVGRIAVVCIAVIALITLGSYMYVSRMYGGKYCVIYELDEKGISFTQIEEQFEKQQVIARAAAFTGALTGNIGLVGSALYNMYNNTAYSDFEKVYSVKSYKDKEVIKVNSPFLFNQIYVKKEDFDFVDSFIREHCPKIH